MSEKKYLLTESDLREISDEYMSETLKPCSLYGGKGGGADGADS